MNHDTNTLFIREIRRIVLYTSCLVLGHIQVEKAKCPLSSLFVVFPMQRGTVVPSAQRMDLQLGLKTVAGWVAEPQEHRGDR